MGNRAVIAFDKKPTAVGIYVHWNGGAESVLAFLEVCRRRGYRSPEQDPSYAMARLIGVMHEFFDGGLSLGVGNLRDLDVNNWDNGAYLVGGDWKIRSRWGSGADECVSVEQLGPKGREVYDGIVESLMGERAAA